MTFAAGFVFRRDAVTIAPAKTVTTVMTILSAKASVKKSKFEN